MADMLRPPGQHRDHVLARHHAAIDADIHHIGVRVLGDDAAVSENVAAAVGAVPLRRREIIQIHIVAFDDVLLDRPGVDDFRRDRAGQHGAAELDQFARMSVGRQPEHHGDAPIARQRAGKHLPAAGVLAIVADLVEQQRRPGAGPLGQPRHGAKLDIPIDLGVDRLQLAGAIERLQPAAQIAEDNGFAFYRHGFSRLMLRRSSLPAGLVKSRPRVQESSPPAEGRGAAKLSRGRESARKRAATPAVAAPPTPRSLRSVPLPASRGRKAIVLTTRSASELRPGELRIGEILFAIHHSPLAFFFPQKRRGGRTPTDAGHQPPHLRCGARSFGARTPVGVPPRLSPKGIIPSQRLGFRPGFLGRGLHGRYPPSPVPVQGAPPTPVIMPGG